MTMNDFRFNNCHWGGALLGAVFALCPVVALAAEKTITRIDVFPPDVQLTTNRDHQSFIVVATRSDDVTLDVTSEAKVAVANPALVKLEGATYFPLADGATEATIEYGGFTAKQSISVAAAAQDRAVSFKLDVMPIFLRAGCNTGSCHGAARGKDGFMLSLFGYDPDGDHHRIKHRRELADRKNDRSRASYGWQTI
jgi:hypothetical protein